jgi:nitrite reductase/ring-hydroxylating ferredoxin subunit
VEVRVPNAAHLKHGQSIKFVYDRDGREEEGFVLRVGPAWVAYRNQCRHWSVDLDMGEGRFWNERLDRIVCQTHGARYRVHDGYCDFGPCAGEWLEAFAVRLQGDDAIVSIGG